MRRLLRIIRNVVAFLLIAVVLLGGVLAYSTFRHGSRQIQIAAIPPVAVDETGAAQRLAEAIRFYSHLFAAEPVVRKDDYAKWMLDDPRVNFAISSRSSEGSFKA